MKTHVDNHHDAAYLRHARQLVSYGMGMVPDEVKGDD